MSSPPWCVSSVCLINTRLDAFYKPWTVLYFYPSQQHRRIDTQPVSILYKNHRFPPEIMSQVVWLYQRFCLSFRDVEELLAARGVVVTYEAVRTRKTVARGSVEGCVSRFSSERGKMPLAWFLSTAILAAVTSGEKENPQGSVLI
jgi:hypothetical protein